MKQIIPFIFAILVFTANPAVAQSCTPQGDQLSYGSGNSWIGYIYQGINFNTYKGYINEGSVSSPNFDESFSGNQVNFGTHGCNVYTDTFSVRFKLAAVFSNGNYTLTVGGDDGIRLSLDGGNTWVINHWVDQSYTTYTYNVHLNGSYNLVLEYYEKFGANRVSFNISTACGGSEDPAVYGTNGKWNGYLYQGMNFDLFKGSVLEGSNGNFNFNENFGGGSNPVTYNTSSCPITTTQFSARYRLQQTLSAGTYLITVGGDDGYRFSLDGGNTWVINKWVDQSYGITTYTANLAAGTYNFVIEFYQNGGYAQISFNMSASAALPVRLEHFTATPSADGKVQLAWTAAAASNFDHFVLQRSRDGINFGSIAQLPAQASNSNSAQYYHYTDLPGNGKVFYRLQLVDKDGSSTYSGIVSASLAESTGARLYPTLVENSMIFIETSTALPRAKLELFDMNGRRLGNQPLNLNAGRQQVSLAGPQPAAGSYLVLLTQDNEVVAKKIIIVRK